MTSLISTMKHLNFRPIALLTKQFSSKVTINHQKITSLYPRVVDGTFCMIPFRSYQTGLRYPLYELVICHRCSFKEAHFTPSPPIGELWNQYLRNSFLKWQPCHFPVMALCYVVLIFLTVLLVVLSLISIYFFIQLGMFFTSKCPKPEFEPTISLLL